MILMNIVQRRILIVMKLQNILTLKNLFFRMVLTLVLIIQTTINLIVKI
jgi:hypothetical protein